MRVNGLLIAVIIAGFGCADRAPGEYVEKMLWLEGANPEVDARKHAKQGSCFVYGAYGYTIEIPGVPVDDWPAFYENAVIRMIEGTSDVIESEEHLRLNNLARQYASRFNQTILEESSCGTL